MAPTQRRESHSSSSSTASAPAGLLSFMKERRINKEVPKDFAAFERALHARVMALEREVLAEELAQADVSTDAIEVGGIVYRRVVRCSDEYVTAAGPVRVEVVEDQREAFEAALRKDEIIPEGTVVVAVSLDGVLAPMKDGERMEKRADAAAAGRLTNGPAGHREVACGTISMYDAEGDLSVSYEWRACPRRRRQRPSLRLVKIADGAKDKLDVPLPSAASWRRDPGLLSRCRAPLGRHWRGLRRRQHRSSIPIRSQAPRTQSDTRPRVSRRLPTSGLSREEASRQCTDRNRTPILQEQSCSDAIRQSRVREPPHRVRRRRGRVQDTCHSATQA